MRCIILTKDETMTELKLKWEQTRYGSECFARCGVLKVTVSNNNQGTHPKGTEIAKGYKVHLTGYASRALTKLFPSQLEAQLAAERLLVKIVRELAQLVESISTEVVKDEVVKTDD